MPQEKIYSVTEITRELKKLIQNGLATIWIEGEISGYKPHSSGHHYFTLKDAGAQLSCAMWRMNASRLAFRPQDGMRVQAWGNIDVYEPSGRYQLIVAMMRQAGIGDLQRAFEELVQKLRAEGLFDPERKRGLPEFPERIGIVTSPDGAALHDMRTVAAKRWPAAKLVLSPVRVQGSGAAEEIAAAITRFSDEGAVDVIVIGRGGGSLEDLWAFNTEVVARAVFQSNIPVVSAVGHEVDFTISDFAADVRAATPSAAMEIILPDRTDVQIRILNLAKRMAARQTVLIRSLRERIDLLSHHWALRQPANLVLMAHQRADDFQGRLIASFESAIREKTSAADRAAELLHVLSPRAMLERGYAIVSDESGVIVRDATRLSHGSRVHLALARGQAVAEVRETTSTNVFDERESKPK